MSVKTSMRLSWLEQKTRKVHGPGTWCSAVRTEAPSPPGWRVTIHSVDGVVDAIEADVRRKSDAMALMYARLESLQVARGENPKGRWAKQG